MSPRDQFLTSLDSTEPLPTPAEALDLPLRSFPPWFLKITCDRCGENRMLNEVHAPERRHAMPIRVLLARMRHDGCGGRAGGVELLTGVDGVSSRSVRQIVLNAPEQQEWNAIPVPALRDDGPRRVPGACEPIPATRRARDG